MNIQFTDQLAKALSAASGEPSWRKDARLKAYETFQTLQLPTKQIETWRYMDLNRLSLDQIIPSSFNGQTKKPATLPASLQAVLHEEEHDAGVLVWGNGRGWSAELDPALRKLGVRLMDLGEALVESPELVKQVMGTQVKPETDKFLAWHHAFSQGGVFVYVPKGVVIEKPLRTVYWWDQEGMACFPHTVVLVEEGAKVTYVDEYLSPDFTSDAFCQSVVEIIVRPNAHMHYFNVQRWGKGMSHFVTARGRIERDAQLTSAFFALGGSVHRGDIGTNVAAEGAVSNMYGAVVGTENQHVEHITLQDHTAPHTTSDLLFKTALTGTSRSVFSGLIHVHKKAQKSNAYQANRNLLLSKTAKADALPKLEIEADDVRCTHGATVGTLDDEQRFYLMSRGLSQMESDQVMVEGFFSELLDRVGVPAVKDRLSQVIAAKLNP